ncbi:MAG: hypothetical protein KKC46_08020 [Proteobacteria bacterium]|nr:hypothetical protein [Pseudomonadota bacterium]
MQIQFSKIFDRDAVVPKFGCKLSTHAKSKFQNLNLSRENSTSKVWPNSSKEKPPAAELINSTVRGNRCHSLNSE